MPGNSGKLNGRVRPRWSVVSPKLLPLSIAGLPGGPIFSTLVELAEYYGDAMRSRKKRRGSVKALVIGLVAPGMSRYGPVTFVAVTSS